MIKYERYPRVLVVGQFFSYKRGGGGITQCNLFKNWPRDKLANLPFSIKDTESSICNNYYQIGKQEKIPNYPILYSNINLESADLRVYKSIEISNNSYENVLGKKNIGKKIKTFIVNIFGLYNNAYRIKLSSKLINWIHDFNPDIIYAQYGPFNTMKFISKLCNKLNKPVIIHIMDDFVKTINKRKYNLLYNYWQRKVEREFKKILSFADKRLVISKLMAEVYRERYGYNFDVFHNPIEVKKWLPYTKKNWEIKKEMKILYTGRIGKANKNSLLQIIKIVKKLNNNDCKFIFHIYSPTKNELSIKENIGVKIYNPIDLADIPELMSKYDVLILPLDFTEIGLDFARLSIPTKTSEYMMSGVPTIVYAPRKTALYQYAEQNKWAYCVGNKNKLDEALIELYHNQKLRKNLGKRAHKLAIENHSAKNVRKNFHEILKKTANR